MHICFYLVVPSDYHQRLVGNDVHWNGVWRIATDVPGSRWGGRPIPYLQLAYE